MHPYAHIEKYGINILLFEIQGNLNFERYTRIHLIQFLPKKPYKKKLKKTDIDRSPYEPISQKLICHIKFKPKKFWIVLKF